MNLLRLLGSASTTIVLLSACTSSLPSEQPGSGGAGAGTSVSSGGTVGAGVVGSRWKAAPDQTFGNMALASAGHEGALAYVESSADDGTGHAASVIKLQRLDSAGARRGTAIELGHAASGSSPRPTIASDGDHYLACWDDASVAQISCAIAPVAEGPAVPALSVAGLSPSLVYSAGAWTLAYGVPARVAVARAAVAGTALGPPTLFVVGQPGTPNAMIAATSDGFALVSAPARGSGEDVRVHRLDSALAPLGAPIDLGKKLWLRDAAALAASGATIAVSVSEPYGSELFILEGGAITRTHSLSGGGKVGNVVALTADGASFGALAQDDSSAPFTYTTFAGDTPIAAPQAPESDAALVFSEPTFALLETAESLLFASTAGQHNDELIVAGVQRP